MFAAIGLMIKGVDAISESATKATGNLQSMFAAGGSMAGGDQGGAAKFAEGAAAIRTLGNGIDTSFLGQSEIPVLPSFDL